MIFAPSRAASIGFCPPFFEEDGKEPPKNTIFLLVSENSDLILKTILSRLQITKLVNHSPKEVHSILQNKFPDKSKSEIDASISFSEGNIGGFSSNWYWSSSESNNYGAYDVNFGDGSTGNFSSKTKIVRVRFIRSF